MVNGALINKWIKMLKGKSTLHDFQSEGVYYSIDRIEGYYNDLRNKVINTKLLDKNGIPYNIAIKGNEKKNIYFPIAIFQYGLGAYDLYLETQKIEYLEMSKKMADWAVQNQLPNGGFDTFGVLEYSNKYSSMAQGEAASLLARLFLETNDQRYYSSCLKAINFMITSINQGGTSISTDDKIYLYEYPDKPIVLNGWIFSSFGLYDCWKLTQDNFYYQLWKMSMNGIIDSLEKFDAGHWSYYDENYKYTSPFYHSLHIELLKVCNKLYPDKSLEDIIQKWNLCRNSFIWSKKAFIIKAMQKVSEKKNDEWVIVA